MGKIFEYFGFIFYFFSNEHEPVHVHVKKGGEECIFDLIIENGQLIRVERREKTGDFKHQNQQKNQIGWAD